MENIIKNVCRAFKINGEFISYEKITNGNVNKTYRVNFSRNGASGAEVKSYILQNLNLYVFKQPQQVMHNIDIVTEHIRRNHPDEINLHFYHTVTGENYYIDETGFWRMLNYIDSVTYNVCDDLHVLYSAGKAFGSFQNMLGDFDADTLFETISDFHNTPKRIQTLLDDVAKDEAGRVKSVKEEIDYIYSVRDEAGRLTEMLKNGELPLRVTHNDTKINNVLFDKKTHNTIAVIDLDTVMPGLVGHDFGDAVRFSANYVAEDSADYSHAGVDMAKFKAFTEGFLSETKNVLTPNEIETLPLSCFALTVELAARFLDDYINGDKYFRTEYPEHNLVRTRCQIALAKDMATKRNAMADIVKACID